MYRTTAVVLLGLLLGAGTLWAEDRPKAPPPLADRVRKAIDNGVRYLRDAEHGQGSWEADVTSVGFKGGWSCLATLALLNSGVKPDDPIIQRSLRFLRDLPLEKTYVVGLQTMVLNEAGYKEDLQRIQRNVDWLIRARVMNNGRFRGWGYGMDSGSSDNSNTQYALLGLHAGKMAGAQIPDEVWRSIRDFYIDSQDKADGGWYYNPSVTGENTFLTMTTAGLAGLLIAGLEVKTGREVLQPDGSATDCGKYDENKPIGRALGYIARNFRVDPRHNTYYNLYGIERAGRLSGLRFFGRHDWYRKGCEYLVGNQRDDGSWAEATMHDNWPVVSTSFALLFLSKGRTPVLVSKLVHGPGDDWNNDHNDARHLTEYAGKELFRRQPLAWQVFDASTQEATSNDAILELTRELLQSPIVYISGHLAPRFTDVEKRLLKQYVEEGGFILAEACCGRPEFTDGFRELMKELFPDPGNELKPLPADHPIWRAHAVVDPNAHPLEGITYGCKTVVVFSPTDLSCAWEANRPDAGPGQLAFRLGGNLVAYATGMEPPKPRLTEVDVVKEDAEGKKIPRGYLKVAQLRHEGDWQPAPKAMRNLLDHVHKTAGVDVDLQTKPLQAADPDLVDFRFLYMHGRGSFTLSPEAVKNLRNDLETGGLLFADACCGRKAFDESFRQLAGQLFPGKKLEAIPPGDDLYSADLNGTAVTTVRCRTEPPAGGASEFREMAPYLEGIKVNDRWVVIYSKYDIGCALEKHQSTDCLGHDHASALRLGMAALLYALKR